jgi:hypothetical protein
MPECYSMVLKLNISFENISLPQEPKRINSTIFSICEIPSFAVHRASLVGFQNLPSQNEGMILVGHVLEQQSRLINKP